MLALDFIALTSLRFLLVELLRFLLAFRLGARTELLLAFLHPVFCRG
jgi:hypothetical protein